MKGIAATPVTPKSPRVVTKPPSKRKFLSHQCWYHGLCSRETTEPLLTKKGDFLVRATENQGSLNIILSFNTGERKLHLTVAVDSNGQFYLKALRNLRAFSTVYDLVKYYRMHKIRMRGRGVPGCSYRLKDGIPKPKWLVQSDLITHDVTKKLGSGNFAEVYKGTFQLTGEAGTEKIVVAVKVLKALQRNSARLKNATDTMMREGKVMSFYSHRNVIQFYGVACDRPGEVILVMEYCPGGSLSKHLIHQRGGIGPGERLNYCLETATGMRYLHSQGCLHRDLAARNCLISATGLIKISDFGLSTVEGVVDRCDVSHLPVRWMSPETLVLRPLFSKMSDVWAFGVLVYEVFNNGERPWPSDPMKKIATRIRRCRMPALPGWTPLELKALVKQIWSKRPKDRPSFPVIVDRLRGMRRGALNRPRASQFSLNRLEGVQRLPLPDDDDDEFSKMSPASELTRATETSTVVSEMSTADELVDIPAATIRPTVSARDVGPTAPAATMPAFLPTDLSVSGSVPVLEDSSVAPAESASMVASTRSDLSISFQALTSAKLPATTSKYRTTKK